MNTVHFSNHTGYGTWRGPAPAPADVAEVIAGIADRGVLGRADAVLSGYQGDPAMGAVILDAVDRVKAANPAAVYCCDPVMGDVGRGLFIRDGIPQYMRDVVVPRADNISPNHFELHLLAGRATTSLTGMLAASTRCARRARATSWWCSRWKPRTTRPWTVDSGSWLAPPARGRGVGVAVRMAALGLAFDHLGAVAAITSARQDNGASLGVSRSIGYTDNGVSLND